MKMARMILFTSQMDKMSKFYGEVLGLKQVSERKGLAGVRGGRRKHRVCIPARPRRAARVRRSSSMRTDVAAMREKLVARGANFGKVREGEMFCLCDGKDPDGNPIQLSNR